MNRLYRKIADLVPSLHGWCEVPKAITLANLVMATTPKTIVEIGVWGGRSFIPMALAQGHAEDCKPELSGFRCIGIDPWDIAASVAGQTTEADKKWWSEINHELVRQSFLYNLRELELEKRCEIIRCTSDEADVPETIDLFHCDGNHGSNALKDTERFGSNIPIGGICVLDDLGWSGGFVAQSGEWLLANGFIQLHPLGTGAVYVRME